MSDFNNSPEQPAWNPQPNGWSQPQPGFGSNLPPLAPAPEKSGNWFARHKVLTGIGAFVLAVSAISAAGGGGTKEPATAAEQTKTSVITPAATETTAEPKVETKTEAPAEEIKAEAPKVEKPVAKIVDGLQPGGKSWIYGDWKVSNLKISNTQYLDVFKIVADVKYLGEDTSGGDKCFDISLDKGSRQVASGTGCADSIQPGKTASLEFASFDDFVSGPYDITLNKSW